MFNVCLCFITLKKHPVNSEAASLTDPITRHSPPRYFNNVASVFPSHRLAL